MTKCVSFTLRALPFVRTDDDRCVGLGEYDGHHMLLWVLVWLNRCILEVGEMGLLKTGVAALLGFVIGVALYHPDSARAASNVYVQQVPVGTYNPIRGSNVVGFSCAGSGANTACYIASQ